MQRIINALARNKNTVLFILLLIISLYFLNSRSYFHQTKIAKLSLSISGILNNLSSNIIRYSNLNKENKLLIQENLIEQTSNKNNLHKTIITSHNFEYPKKFAFFHYKKKFFDELLDWDLETVS